VRIFFVLFLLKSISAYFASDKGNTNIERIVERRYYVKKSNLKIKCDELTSTTDLSISKNITRQFSTVSSSTRSYIEDIHHQSDLFRNDLNQLKYK
jgi:DUF4097 and DUF4098 domain-containing protein YvlB